MTKKIKLKVSSRLLKKRTRRSSNSQPKHCRFCSTSENKPFLDYKNSNLLYSFLTERGKILPARISGTCASHQRKLSSEIKLARIMALVPFTSVRF